MILVDLSQIAISNIFAAPGEELNEDLIRHMVLNSLRYYKTKFGPKYGKLVICVDNRQYWRKEVFPHYKSGRKKTREKSSIDWHLIFDTINKIREELTEFFPYKVLNVVRAEADDVIAVITKLEHTVEKILILSGDRDFNQLHAYKNVDQYAPIQKKFIHVENPIDSLREHILKGDEGDGIPNFVSPDDTFVTGKRQMRIGKNDLARWSTMDPLNFCTPAMLVGYKRNQKLIDFNFIPKDVQQAIKDVWDAPFLETRKHLLNYFVKHKLANLMSEIHSF